MAVRFFCDFNENTQDRVSLANGTATGVIDPDDYLPFADGRKGLGFDAADVRRIWYPLTLVNQDYLAFGCKIKKTVAFDAAAAGQRLLTIAMSTELTTTRYYVEFNSTTDGLSFMTTNTGSGGGAARTLAVATFPVAVGAELSLACVVMPDPDEPAGAKRIFRAYVNGYCIFSENRPGNEFPKAGINQIYIGAKEGALANDCGCIMRDVWVIDGERLQDYALLRIHEEGFDPAAITDATIYREPYAAINYSRAVVSYPVEAVNDGRLWGHDSGKVYYTDDETGATGWTEFAAASPGTMQSVFAVGAYVYASVPGKLYRSPIAVPAWTEVLAMTAANYQVPGWGYTHKVVGATTYLVIGEYKTLAGGSRILRSIDFGDTWDVLYTCDAAATSHIHSVRYAESGRLWCARGDVTDNVGYSDDNGTTWTWLLDEVDHAPGSQLIGQTETAQRIMMGIDGVCGALCTAWRKDLSDIQTQLTRSGWDNSWHFVGQSGGDEHGSPGWCCVTLPTGFVLIYQWCENAGQRSSLYLADKTGTVCLRLEDLGVDTQITAGHSSAVCSSQRAFVGNCAFPLSMFLVGGPLSGVGRAWKFNGVDMSQVFLRPSWAKRFIY